MVFWYLVRTAMLIAPDASERNIATKVTHSYEWEMWTLDRRGDGPNIQIPQRVRPKYRGIQTSMVYDTEYDGVNDATIPTVALVRAEYDGTTPPFAVGDYLYHLTTKAHWDQLLATYPTLCYRFADAPYYPAT